MLAGATRHIKSICQGESGDDTGITVLTGDRTGIATITISWIPAMRAGIPLTQSIPWRNMDYYNWRRLLIEMNASRRYPTYQEYLSGRIGRRHWYNRPYWRSYWYRNYNYQLDSSHEGWHPVNAIYSMEEHGLLQLAKTTHRDEC